MLSRDERPSTATDLQVLSVLDWAVLALIAFALLLCNWAATAYHILALAPERSNQGNETNN